MNFRIYNNHVTLFFLSQVLRERTTQTLFSEHRWTLSINVVSRRTTKRNVQHRTDWVY